MNDFSTLAKLPCLVMESQGLVDEKMMLLFLWMVDGDRMGIGKLTYAGLRVVCCAQNFLSLLCILLELPLATPF